MFLRPPCVSSRFVGRHKRTSLRNSRLLAKSLLRVRKQEHFVLRFDGRDQEKTLSIAPSFFFVQRSRYSTYEDLKTEFFDVLCAFLDSYPEAIISRFGLRFINEIVLEDGPPTDWQGYLDKRLLSVLDFFPNRDELCRAFNIVELRFGDLQLKYQFECTTLITHR